MMPHNASDLARVRMDNRLDNLLSQCGMCLHDFPLIRLQAVWFEQDPVGNADLPDIVQARCSAQNSKFLGIEFTQQTEVRGEGFDTAAVACGIRVLFFESNSKTVVLIAQGKRGRKCAFDPAAVLQELG